MSAREAVLDPFGLARGCIAARRQTRYPLEYPVEVKRADRHCARDFLEGRGFFRFVDEAARRSDEFRVAAGSSVGGLAALARPVSCRDRRFGSLEKADVFATRALCRTRWTTKDPRGRDSENEMAVSRPVTRTNRFPASIVGRIRVVMEHRTVSVNFKNLNNCSI